MRRKILESAVATIADEGVSVSTAVIAKRGGLAQGSIFHHFGTKAGLLNALYLQLKAEQHAAAVGAAPESLRTVWDRWLDWGTANQQRRRALLALRGSDVVTPESRAASEDSNQSGVDLFRQLTADGPLAGLPMQYIGDLVEAVAGTTMDAIVRDPANAAVYRDRGFDALRGMLA
ncbi:TetR/AcrR family transcriptional regulator [Cryptosporangium sp. NPDC048952]|uniref:TetR/AcrR family transcriptional regulator n=1 Tax=Cryptosporangium sp. NPDC048952 TaxID=3363961 RepID=UPI003710F9D6